MNKATRKQPTRQAQQAAAGSSTQLDPEVIAKRTKRRLDDLERSNYTEQKETLFGVGDGDEEGAKPSNRARETLNLRNDGKQKKKSTAAVRSILLYRKTFNALLEESGLADAPGPNYLTAAAPPSKYPSRMLCQVCGYFGSYRCKKCGIPYCTISCRDTHDETGCERRLVA